MAFCCCCTVVAFLPLNELPAGIHSLGLEKPSRLQSSTLSTDGARHDSPTQWLQNNTGLRLSQS